MTRPRKELISLSDTPYYHIVSRCVRRAFLCGVDNTQNYEHRRQWAEERIRLLASLFAIDICAYAVMSNHYHIVLKCDPEQATNWSQKALRIRVLKSVLNHDLMQIKLLTTPSINNNLSINGLMPLNPYYILMT